MSPIGVTTALAIAKGASDVSKQLYELGKGIKDRDLKHKIDEIADKVRELKQAASELEDENRDLREKLRFKSDEYEFRTPFWYSKTNPRQALCPKCFASNVPAPMGEPGQNCNQGYRRCLVCHHYLEIKHQGPDIMH